MSYNQSKRDYELLNNFCRRHGAHLTQKTQYNSRSLSLDSYFQHEYLTQPYAAEPYCELEIPLSRLVQIAVLDERIREEQNLIATNEAVRNAYEQFRTVLNLCVNSNATLRY